MGYKHHRIVDLTQELYDGQPVFIGHPETKVWPCMTHEESAKLPVFKDGMSYAANLVQMCEHGPTHVDSISHLDPRPEAPSIEQIPVEWFYTPAICADFPDVPARTSITPDMVKRRLEHYRLTPPKGGTFLFTTGHYQKYYPKPEYCTEYAGLDRKAAEYLYGECGILNIGQDAPSIDNAADRGFPCHLVCRELQRVNTENLCNLEAVAGKEFLYIGLPLKIRKGTGSPIRAIAVLNA
jgi:kynurenine formamidase